MVQSMADIHNSEQQKKRVLQKLETESSYSEEELEAIRDFKLGLEEEGQGSRRVQRYLQTFNRLDTEVEFDLTDPELKEVRELIAEINNGFYKENGEEYSPWTLVEFRKGLKKFYIHHLGRESEIVEEVKWKLSVDKSNRPIPSPDELPGPSDVKEMVKSAETLRNETLIFFLWDTGARISEALNVKWKDVKFNEKGAKIKIRESKSQPREIPIFECVEHLRDWKHNSPATDPEDYLFVNTGDRGVNKKSKGEQMVYESAYSVVKKCASRIGQDYSPHDFRRGRATFLASKGWNAPTLCQYFGWSDFKTAETYIQLADKDMESAMAKLQGIETEDEEDEESDLRPAKCGNCGEINPATRDYCKGCEHLISKEKELMRESVLNEEKHNVKDEAINTLVQDFGIGEEEVEERLREKTRERMKDRGFL